MQFLFRLSTAQREQSAAIQQLNSVKELLEKEKAENGTLKVQKISAVLRELSENIAQRVSCCSHMKTD